MKGVTDKLIDKLLALIKENKNLSAHSAALVSEMDQCISNSKRLQPKPKDSNNGKVIPFPEAFDEEFDPRIRKTS